jgi:hypothetical protein
MTVMEAVWWRGSTISTSRARVIAEATELARLFGCPACRSGDADDADARAGRAACVRGFSFADLIVVHDQLLAPDVELACRCTRDRRHA